MGEFSLSSGFMSMRVAFAAGLLALARADLPMHCLRDQVLGTWDLEIGAETTPMSGARDFDCGLASPQTAQAALKAFDVKRKLSVKLELPYVATSSDGHKGTWTMIYDEGVEIRVGGKKYFAYFKYEMDKDGSCLSTCSATVNGYVHNDDRSDWGCWKGTRQGAVEQTRAFPPADEEASTREDAERKQAIDKTLKDAEVKVAHPLDAKYQPETDLVSAINAMQTEYTANIYPQFHGKSLRDLQNMAGGRSHKNAKGKETGDLASFLQLADVQAGKHQSKGRHTHKHTADKLHNKLPKSWDWRKVNGQNFLFPPVNQGSCGSCYAVAVADMITARVAVQTNNTLRMRMAAQELLSCGEKWNQGCDGGFPYLASKYVADFGLTSEDCYAYEEDAYNAPEHYGNGCKLDKLMKEKPDACKFRVKASKYNY